MFQDLRLFLQTLVLGFSVNDAYAATQQRIQCQAHTVAYLEVTQLVYGTYKTESKFDILAIHVTTPQMCSGFR